MKHIMATSRQIRERVDLVFLCSVDIYDGNYKWLYLFKIKLKHLQPSCYLLSCREIQEQKINIVLSEFAKIT